MLRFVGIWTCSIIAIAVWAVSCSGNSENLSEFEGNTVIKFVADNSDCMGCHQTVPGGGDWDDAPGDHAECDECHTGEHGTSPDPPSSVCLDCHQSDWEDEHPSGATTCLACHVSPHLPEENDCIDCHTTVPGGGNWDDAPGDHDDCWACHNGDHGWSPSPPESICLDCHQSDWEDEHPSGATSCLACHVSPHIPQENDCTDCHTTVPGGGDWDDAPGDHDDCWECHTGDHGWSPSPPDSICLDCHQNDWEKKHPEGATSCLACHVSPHIPQKNACTDCHSNPPEKPDQPWSKAPGKHKKCFECHTGDHGWSPNPPESVCLNCHQKKWEKKHDASATQCLSCHLWPHLPLKIKLKPGIHKKHKQEGIQCYSCHRMMGGIMPDRARCLACHTERETEHSQGALCRICHKS